MAATEGAPAVPGEEKKLSIVGVAVLGIGSMVGAGIFALLGEAAVVAGSAVWLSFLLAGGVTILLAYNVIKLGIRYPSSGGLIEYLRQGFGNGRLLGVASWLGYAAAFVIVTAMKSAKTASRRKTSPDATRATICVPRTLIAVIRTITAEVKTLSQPLQPSAPKRETA